MLSADPPTQFISLTLPVKVVIEEDHQIETLLCLQLSPSRLDRTESFGFMPLFARHSGNFVRERRFVVDDDHFHLGSAPSLSDAPGGESRTRLPRGFRR